MTTRLDLLGITGLAPCLMIWARSLSPSYAFVGEKRAHRWCERQNIGGSSDVGILTLGQMQDDRPAERIAQRMDFCRTTAPRPADGLIMLPPFPPEAHR